MKHIPELIPVPDDERHGCLQCARDDRDTLAVVLLVEEDDPWPTGMCGNHAEVMDLDDVRDAQEWLEDAIGERL